MTFCITIWESKLMMLCNCSYSFGFGITIWCSKMILSFYFWCWVYKYPKEPSRTFRDPQGPSEDTPRTSRCSTKGLPRTPRTSQGYAKLVILWNSMSTLPIVIRSYHNDFFFMVSCWGHICMYIRIYIHMYIYVYIYICTHICSLNKF